MALHCICEWCWVDTDKYAVKFVSEIRQRLCISDDISNTKYSTGWRTYPLQKQDTIKIVGAGVGITKPISSVPLFS